MGAPFPIFFVGKQMEVTMNEGSSDKTAQGSRAAIARWLRSDVTITLPGWAFASAGALALLLLLVALD